MTNPHPPSLFSNALDVIPRNPSRSPVPKRLGFSSTFNRTSYLSNPASSIRASVSASFSSNLDAIVKAFARQSFVTRARGVGVSRAVEASEKERPIPDIRTGDIVEIKLEVPENRRRLPFTKALSYLSRMQASTLRLGFGGLLLA
uniref:Uncharacterized protein n=1 Tax=Salix viminalis TaxID=40686 RepID=A0A6N2MWT1_SALVM